MKVPGPSRASETSASGTGTTSADHTVSDSPPGTPDARDDDVADRPGQRGQQAEAEREQRDVAAATEAHDQQPDRPEPDAEHLGRVGRSRSMAAAIRMVSTTCAWSTSPASPAGIPAAIAE